MSFHIKNERLVLFVYSLFSYFSGMLWNVLEVLPPFLRNMIFRLIFKRFGRQSLLDYRCYVRYPWRVSIGDNVAVNRNCEFYPSMQSDEGIITLEDNAVLGPGVVLLTASHDYTSLRLPDISGPIMIGRHAWVGAKSIILPGVRIGEGAVIGAGSIVTKDVPAYCIAVGNPARVIKDRHIAAR